MRMKSGQYSGQFFMVCDVGQCLGDGDIKGVSHFDAQHEATSSYLSGRRLFFLVPAR